MAGVAFWGSLALSILASIVAVACIDYFFAAPIFSLNVANPLDGIAIVMFLAVAVTINTLAMRVRTRTEQLEAAYTDLQRQVEERERVQGALQQAQDFARVNRVMLMGQMTASIAHEINQPLAAIVANAGTSLRYLSAPTPDLDEARYHLDFIARDGKRAAEIISRVRALIKRAPANPSIMDLNETVLETIAMAQSQIQRNPVELRTYLADDLPRVSADRIQLQQVILNLIVNAIEAMSNEQIQERDLVVTSGKNDPEHIFVEVGDSGRGFDGADLERIFNPFFTTKPEGMGMGLSISRLIIENHGGKLSAHPNTPCGAVFRFTLPVGGL